MTYPIPTPAALTQGVSLRVADYSELELIATADDTGVASVSTDQLQQSQILRVERIVVTGDSENECLLGVYTGDGSGSILPQRIRDWTPLPPSTIGVAEYPQFLTITPTYCLTIYIEGANEGDVFTAAVQYQLVLKIVGKAGG
jgi:hypothetical protein